MQVSSPSHMTLGPVTPPSNHSVTPPNSGVSASLNPSLSCKGARRKKEASYSMMNSWMNQVSSRKQTEGKKGPVSESPSSKG